MPAPSWWLVICAAVSLVAIVYFWLRREYLGGEEADDMPPLDSVPWLDRDGMLQ